MSDQEKQTIMTDDVEQGLLGDQTSTYKGKSSISVSVMNFLNSIIGVGVMTLPYVLQTAGYMFGFILVFAVAILGHASFKYIALASEHTGMFAYKDIAEKLFGSKTWGIIVSVIMMIYVSGSLGSYAIAIMDNMFWWPGEENRTWRLLLCAGIMLFIVFPLSCLKNLDFMKFNSYITMLCEVIIAIIITGFFFIFDEPKEVPVAFKFDFNVMKTLPLITASLCGHFATPYVYKELRNRSIKRMDRVIILNGIFLLMFYLPIMFFGFFTFTSLLHSDVLKTIALYAHNAWYLKLANILMLILIVSHFPVTCFGMRAAIESIVWQNKKVPFLGTVVIVFLTIIILIVVAFFVDEIADVLDVTSSLAGSFVVFVIPGVFQITRIKKQQPSHWSEYFVPILLVVMGAITLVFGLSATIAGWFS